MHGSKPSSSWGKPCHAVLDWLRWYEWSPSCPFRPVGSRKSSGSSWPKSVVSHKRTKKKNGLAFSLPRRFPHVDLFSGSVELSRCPRARCRAPRTPGSLLSTWVQVQVSCCEVRSTCVGSARKRDTRKIHLLQQHYSTVDPAFPTLAARCVLYQSVV